MRIIEIAQFFYIDPSQFKDYLKNKLNLSDNVDLYSVDFRENDVLKHIEGFKEYLQTNDPYHEEKLKVLNEKLDRIKKAKQKALAESQAKEEKQRALASMLITSGFSFDGYKITKYSGYISGDDAIQIDRGTDGIFFSKATDVGQALTDSLVKIRRRALQELKEAAYDLGCNAVIGVDFDYITLDPETANSKGGTTYLPYVFCVTANGNAVVIEKDE
jgi:uncharacterized protein YbjQ (UPF0145 family)